MMPTPTTTTTITTERSYPIDDKLQRYEIKPSKVMRSKSIAIKQRHNNNHNPNAINATDCRHEFEDVDRHDLRRMYDDATWRMYNRIIDHRRSQITLFGRGCYSAENTHKEKYIARKNCYRRSSTDIQSPQYRSFDTDQQNWEIAEQSKENEKFHYYDGDIFELEL